MKRRIIKRNKAQWFYLLKSMQSKQCEIKKLLNEIKERNSIKTD